MKQEGRHIDFYASQATKRLDGNRRAQKVTRWALQQFWTPVGAGIKEPDRGEVHGDLPLRRRRRPPGGAAHRPLHRPPPRPHRPPPGRAGSASLTSPLDGSRRLVRGPARARATTAGTRKVAIRRRSSSGEWGAGPSTVSSDRIARRIHSDSSSTSRSAPDQPGAPARVGQRGAPLVEHGVEQRLAGARDGGRHAAALAVEQRLELGIVADGVEQVDRPTAPGRRRSGPGCRRRRRSPRGRVPSSVRGCAAAPRAPARRGWGSSGRSWPATPWPRWRCPRRWSWPGRTGRCRPRPRRSGARWAASASAGTSSPHRSLVIAATLLVARRGRSAGSCDMCPGLLRHTTRFVSSLGPVRSVHRSHGGACTMPEYSSYQELIDRDEANDLDAILSVANPLHRRRRSPWWPTTPTPSSRGTTRRAPGPALNKLYEKAKTSQWNGETDLDWSIDVDQEAIAVLRQRRRAQLGGHGLRPDRHPARQVGRRRSGSSGAIEQQNWTLSQFMHGEQGALLCTAKIVETVPWIDAKYYAVDPGDGRGPPRRGLRQVPRHQADRATTRSTPTSGCCSTTSSPTAAGT